MRAREFSRKKAQKTQKTSGIETFWWLFTVLMRQRILRPIKFLASKARIIPGSAQGKKWLKRIVFGELVRMPAEIGPRISRNEEIIAAKRRKNRKNGKSLYRGRYVEPDKISATEPDKIHKVIYCVATLD